VTAWAGWGSWQKLNENKMANRCAMRQRPNPKREVPSQPTPCEIIRVLLVLATCRRGRSQPGAPALETAPAAEPGILSFTHTAICWYSTYVPTYPGTYPR